MHRLIKSECPATPDPAAYLIGVLPLYGVALDFNHSRYEVLDTILTPALTIFAQDLEEMELLAVFLFDPQRSRRKWRTVSSVGADFEALGVCGIGIALDALEREDRATYIPWLFLVELARLMVPGCAYQDEEHIAALRSLVEQYDVETRSNLTELYIDPLTP